MNWKAVEINYSKPKIIISVLLLYHVTELLIIKAGVNLNEISILQRVLCAVGILIIHEGIHFLIGIILTKDRGKTHIGFIPSRLTFYMNVDGTYKFYCLILNLLGPFFVLTILLGIFLFTFNIYNPLLWIIVFYNSFISALDIYNVIFIIKKYSLSTEFKLSEFVLYSNEA
ncbi:MAG: DUF3267 domain-containing protein [Clostridium argentinense]|uniref:DUF3267 domain-containing protein n=1 Tax=Clostridium butanoliproducens TaxID=2991837 RepID=UPI001E149EBD|nr:DUF3267 domain-containing protein [Clostridium butanoliproducens]MBS5823358.1 DUF3267 domain-containing protein [Clostridium argentinense]MDU1348029.1 DUF3267 domain-containing protein [Clostridium argentinense]